MTEEEKIEYVARAMCEAEWLDPDLLIHAGVPLMAPNNRGYAARPLTDACPYWTFRRREAEAAIEAMDRLIAATDAPR